MIDPRSQVNIPGDIVKPEFRSVPTTMPPRKGIPWTGVPEQSPDGFRMTLPDEDRPGLAVCEVWTNPIGWELRLAIDGSSLQMATVVGSADAMRALVETWRNAMSAKGWS